MRKKDLETEKAQLESQVDHLEAELTFLHLLLMEVGFEDGIETLKMAAHELLLEQKVS